MPIHGYPGGVITANPVAPTSSVATGVWTTEQQLQAVSQGNWPGYEYPIANSLRFNSADSAYLNRTPASTSNRQIWTYSTWVKRSSVAASKVLLGAVGSSRVTYIWFNASNNLGIYSATASGGGDGGEYVSSAIYRDPSAWYHIVVAYDSTQATSTNRIKAYVNGIQITAWATATAPTLNHETQYNWTGAPMQLGAYNTGSFFDGYLTEVNFIDGQALDPSSFGLNDPETGVWSPKRYTGTYGTNGFYLPMTTEGQWSGYFDGSGDYLTVANNAALNFGTSAFTVECWFYRTSSAAIYGLWSLNSVTSGYAGARAQINTNGSIDVYISQNGSSWANSITNRGSTTVNTWNHLAVVRESNGDIKIYINGTQAGATVTNANSLYAGTSHLIAGVYSAGSPSSVFPGYISNFRSVVGTAVYTSNFTPPTSQLTAITNTQLLTCQSSTFVDNSINALTITAAGDSRPQQFSPFGDSIDDRSGQGNNWIPNNLDLRTTGAGADIMVDTPTAYGTDTGVGGTVRGNYATLNPLNKNSAITLANGNLDFSASNNRFVTSTIAVSSGKWYWEFVPANGSTGASGIGVIRASDNVFGTDAFASAGSYVGVGYLNNGQKSISGTRTSYGATYTTNNVIGVALDLDSGTQTITFYKNNSSQGSINLPSAGQTWIVATDYSESGTHVTNFGQRAFAYTAPSGFKALCTQNLPTPTIGATSTTQANDYMNVVLYTGTGSNLGVTGVNFQPDLVWIKGRSGATDHGWYDAVRGVQQQLESNTTTAETTETTGLTAFGTDGFTVGALAQLNTSSATYVAWNWNAGGSNATNTAGTITSTVRANTTSGFSIVTYTGTGANATVGHGLGVAPGMVILKDRGSVNSWYVWHSSLTGSQCLLLNLTNAVASSSTFWNSTIPSSTVFSLGTDSGPNRSTGTYVAYCFAPVAGYSAFGSYTGNGSTDGPFVYLGFRPEFIMTKSTSNLREWYMYDAARDTYNVSANYLRANTSSAEGSFTSYDMVSNGFKLRSSDTAFNGSGETYIYMAFAEFPFKYSLAR